MYIRLMTRSLSNGQKRNSKQKLMLLLSALCVLQKQTRLPPRPKCGNSSMSVLWISFIEKFYLQCMFFYFSIIHFWFPYVCVSFLCFLCYLITLCNYIWNFLCHCHHLDQDIEAVGQEINKSVKCVLPPWLILSDLN